LNTGWDGSYKGKPVDLGSYAYIMNFEGIEMGNLVKGSKHGSVTLVK
jgi:hypothetical protein